MFRFVFRLGRIGDGELREILHDSGAPEKRGLRLTALFQVGRGRRARVETEREQEGDQA